MDLISGSCQWSLVHNKSRQVGVAGLAAQVSSASSFTCLCFGSSSSVLHRILSYDVTQHLKLNPLLGGHIVLHLRQYSCHFKRHQRQCRWHTILKAVHPLAVCWHVDDRLDSVKSFASFSNVFFLCRDSSSETEDAKVDKGIQERRREEEENWQKIKAEMGRKKIQIARIMDERNRHVSARKLCAGLDQAKLTGNLINVAFLPTCSSIQGFLLLKKQLRCIFKRQKTQIWAKSCNCVFPMKSLYKLGSRFQI